MRVNQKNISGKKTNVARSSGDFFAQKSGILRLADGSEYLGLIPEWLNETVCGEVVFNTGMTGYVETLTDPSYADQILIFTYPLIGNYGVHNELWESKKIHAKAVVVANLVDNWSHPTSSQSFNEWLKSQNVPIISDIDTRALTQYLRSKGTMLGNLQLAKQKKQKMELVSPIISIDKPIEYNKTGKKKVILIDCGAKQNIVRSLVARDMHVRRVPHDFDFSKEKYDGVVLSNGPGNPTDYMPTVKIIKNCLSGSKPVFGICLGNQLMSLAVGASTYKLKFGHRGHNQPCMDKTNKKCYITSQNHGYAVDGKTLPKDWKVLFRNLNDDSVEGIYHTSKPFFSVQFHPEASPGPTDSEYLFDKFVSML